MDDDEVEDCQVWFAFRELARTDTTVAECVAAQRQDERDLMRTLLRDRADDATIDIVLALVDGLRLAISFPEPMPVAQAHAALDNQLELMGLTAQDLGLVERRAAVQDRSA